MTSIEPRLCRFGLVPPRHVLSQKDSLEWLACAHAESIVASVPGSRADAFARAVERMRALIARCACSSDRIALRGTEISDFTHLRWDEMKVYPLRRAPEGVGTYERALLYEAAVDGLFERAYAATPERPSERAPRDVIHVTCTGYVSPSAAQKLVSARGWGDMTRVTHAYHMGCYAAVPALRVAWGLLGVGRIGPDTEDRVDIVHTELCSLHLDFTQHTPEQFVIQSLFADGVIRYALLPGGGGGEPGLRVLSAREALVPDTADCMRWIPSNAGMHMSLGRNVPQRIAGAILPFLKDLCRDAGLDFAAERRTAAFAVHPGGPRIIDQVAQALELDSAQVAASRRVLLEHGNMSSATLPHVWMRLIEGPDAVAPGRIVVSLAFGPGLTVCGAIFRKE